MKPLGFESTLTRLRGAFLVGAAASVVVPALVAVPAIFIRGVASFGDNLWLCMALSVIGLLSGFVLRCQWPEFAPPQPRDEGDEAAGVAARITPPLQPLHGSQHRDAGKA